MATITSTVAKSDSAIREDVIFELKYDPKITSPDIAVAVKDGVVTLSGYASSYWEKDAAEKAAKRVYGVRASPTTFRSSCDARGRIPRSHAMPFTNSRVTSAFPPTRSK